MVRILTLIFVVMFFVPSLANDLSVKELISHAQAGDPEAQFNLGISYSIGGIYGVPQDDKQAFYWFHKSAENGDISGLVTTASYYYQGKVVHKDKVAAFDYYKKAAQKGSADGYYQLALAYSGVGYDHVPLDQVRATQYFQHAAQGGLLEAQYQLALRLLNAEGSEKNRDEALKWLHQAAEKGHLKSKMRLLLIA